jgi:hypothetical protein
MTRNRVTYHIQYDDLDGKEVLSFPLPLGDYDDEAVYAKIESAYRETSP